jgi:hypothetical protein
MPIRQVRGNFSLPFLRSIILTPLAGYWTRGGRAAVFKKTSGRKSLKWRSLQAIIFDTVWY